MGTNTPNKRKSSSNANKTPNKIQKLSRSSVSKTVKNKSPKAAIKVNQKQIHGNKSAKSPNKNQKNGKQVTPKGGKKTKQTEKIISDDESDDSMDELNENNDNSSDATDEVDSNEDADIAEESDSEDEAEMEEEVDSNEEQVDEEEADDSDQESDSADELKEDADETKNNCQVSSFSVFVTGLKPNVKFNDVFPGCNRKFFRLFMDENYLFTGEAYVVFRDQESMAKALAKDKSEFDGSVIRVKAKDMFCVNVYGIDENTNFSKIFPRCNIISSFKCTQKRTKKPTGRAFVYFDDKESLEIALEKEQINDNGRILRVEEEINDSNFKLIVEGMKAGDNINDIFPECSIRSFYLCRHPLTKKKTGKTILNVRDEESVQKALLKNGTKYDGHVIKVLREDCRVFVNGLNANSEIKQFFKDCKIQRIDLIKNKSTKECSGTAIVHFKDKESSEKALSKSGRKVQVYTKETTFWKNNK